MMRLATTPPQGAGQVRHTTKTDLLLRHIEGLGVDKVTFNPIGIRVAALAEATGVPAASIPVLLAKHVQSGRVCACKISVPGSGTAPQTEYRRGIGVPMPDWKPLNATRAGIATMKQPQPAVGNATPAAGDPVPPRGEPAVAAVPATPTPEASAVLKEEPAPRKASAGDDFSITLDDTGALIIATCEGVIELQPAHAKRLGHFMVGSERIWNPF